MDMNRTCPGPNTRWILESGRNDIEVKILMISRTKNEIYASL